MPGQDSHPIFIKKLVQRKGLIGRFRDMLSIGGISYYLKTEGIETRIFLYNYFNLLADENFKTKWELNLYSRKGKILKKLAGFFEGSETVVVDTKHMRGLDECGVIHVKINPSSASKMLLEPYTTTFFNQYYMPSDDTKGIIAHSLGAPAAIHYAYNRYSSGWSIEAGFKPFLMIASGCKFHKIGHGKCSGAKLIFINSKKEKMEMTLEKLKPMELRRLDLFEILPELKEHLADKVFSIVIEGENILSKPYLYQSDGVFLMGEHL